jgi:hypothetical protein
MKAEGGDNSNLATDERVRKLLAEHGTVGERVVFSDTVSKVSSADVCVSCPVRLFVVCCVFFFRMLLLVDHGNDWRAYHSKTSLSITFITAVRKCYVIMSVMS